MAQTVTPSTTALNARLARLVTVLESSTTRDVRRDRRQYLVDAITLYFVFPTLLVGMYGMNIELPFERQPWMFGVIIVAIVVWIVCVYIFIHPRIVIDPHDDDEDEE